MPLPTLHGMYRHPHMGVFEQIAVGQMASADAVRAAADMILADANWCEFGLYICNRSAAWKQKNPIWYCPEVWAPELPSRLS